MGGQTGCLGQFTGMQTGWPLTPGFTHSFLSAALTSAAALGKHICDPEEKALQGEACLINRIVPVCITLPTRVTLDDAARAEAC